MNDGQTTNRQTAAGLRDTGGGFRVERGPDWLFVTLDPPSASRADLADGVCRVVQESMAHRVVLEFDHVEAVDERLARAIERIGARVRDDGGLVRICGLSGDNLSRLRAVSSATLLPHFGTRAEAVGGRVRPGQASAGAP
jgi:MFS superfamily sulfate permease-like transporter